MEAEIGNTASTAPTAKILRLPDRAARGGTEGLELVRAACEAAGGSCAEPVEMGPLARRLGLEPRAVWNLAMRLQTERLVRVVSMANGLLRLTPEGVRAAEGEDESGAVSEPPDAATPTGAPRVGGGLAGTRAATASPVVGRDALRGLGGMLGPLKAGLDRLDLAGALGGGQRSELAAEIRTIEAQLGSPRPKRRIVAAALESVGVVVGSAADAAGGAGSETGSEGILRAIDAFLDGNGGAGQTGRAARGAGDAAGEAAGEARAGRAARSTRDGAGLARPGGDPADDEDGSGARRPEEGSAATVRAREAGGVRVRKRFRDDGGRATGRARGPGRPASEAANGAVVEADKGAGSAVEDVGSTGGDLAVRGAVRAAGRSGDAADRTTIEEAGAARRVLRAGDVSGDVVRTTLNGDGEILEEEVVGNVVSLPAEGYPEDGGRAAGRAGGMSESPIRPRLGGDGGVPDPRIPPLRWEEVSVEGSRSGPRPQEDRRRTEDRDAGDLPGRCPRQAADGSEDLRGGSLGTIGSHRAPAVSLASGADGESGTKNRTARNRDQRGERVSEGTQNVQQQSQGDQYLRQAQDFFAQSIGRIKGQMQSDNAQLQSYMRQLPEESQAQVQEMTDSYAQLEGIMDNAAQDAGVQEAMDQAAQEARQNADEATGQGQEPAEQAADQAQGMAGRVGGQAQDAFGGLADSLPEGYQAVGQEFTDQQGNTVLQGQDEEGNTVVAQRVEDEEGNVVDTIYDQRGNLMDEVVPEEGQEGDGEQGGDEAAQTAVGQATDRAGQAAQQAQDTAGQLTDQAGQAAGQATDQAGQAAGQAQEAAGGAAQQAQDTAGRQAQQAAGQAAQQGKQAAGQAAGQAQDATGQASQQGDQQERPNATNAAQQKAQQMGVDLSRVQGSGADGRITVRDVIGTADQERG